jgi:hypothetical protein
MKSSSYLNWFRRLVVLGAVVAAGAFASTAGAFVVAVECPCLRSAPQV